MRWLFRFAVCSGFAIASQAVPQSGQVTRPTPSSNFDIYESVIRFQIKSWELTAYTYCIEVNGGDAGEALLQRLRPLPVKAASQCEEIDQKTLAHVVDKETRKRAVIFDVGAIRRISDSEVDVEGGYLCGSLCMAGGVYRVVHEESGWLVTGFKWHVMA